jgi:hypothetical protein
MGYFNTRLQGRTTAEADLSGPYYQGGPMQFGVDSDIGFPDMNGNREHFSNLLTSHTLRAVSTFKPTCAAQATTYLEKGVLTKTIRTADPFPYLTFLAYLNHTASSESEHIGDKTRSFPTTTQSDELADPVAKRPGLNQLLDKDTTQFQTLDYVLVPRAWFPAVHQSRALPCVYAPSDHFLLESTFCIKLGSKYKKSRPSPKLDFARRGSSDDQRSILTEHYNKLIRDKLHPTRVHPCTAT